jgi:hypothetical protein
MAEFTPEEWLKIRALFDTDAARFGLPERRDESVLVASFNIRKLGAVFDAKGKATRSRGAWRFLGDICSRFDLIGIQELMNDLGGIRFLKDLAGADDYGMAVSRGTSMRATALDPSVRTSIRASGVGSSLRRRGSMRSAMPVASFRVPVSAMRSMRTDSAIETPSAAPRTPSGTMGSTSRSGSVPSRTQLATRSPSEPTRARSAR